MHTLGFMGQAAWEQARLACTACTWRLEVLMDTSREVASLQGQHKPPCPTAPQTVGPSCGSGSGSQPGPVQPTARCCQTAVQSAQARHKHPSCACLNNLCYLNQYPPVNYQPMWKQGSCDPQQRTVHLLGEETVSANEGSCELLFGGFHWCCLSPARHITQCTSAQGQPGTQSGAAPPLGLPYKGGPIKRPLHISIYKAHQRDKE